MAGRRRRRRGIKSYDLAMVVVAVVVVALARAGDWVRENIVIVAAAAVVLFVLLFAVVRWYVGRRRRFATTLAGFLALDPTGFEHAVANVFRASGFRDMRVVGGSGDLAIDITGRDPSGQPVLVQCKRYAPDKRIGSPEVQKFLGMARYRDESARRILVTTSDFTGPALDVGRRAGVELVSGAELVRLALRAAGSAELGELRDAGAVVQR